MGIACDHCTQGNRQCFIPNIDFPASSDNTVRLPTCLSCKEHRRCCVPPLRQAPPTASALQKRASRVKLARKAAQAAATPSAGPTQSAPYDSRHRSMSSHDLSTSYSPSYSSSLSAAATSSPRSPSVSVSPTLSFGPSRPGTCVEQSFEASAAHYPLDTSSAMPRVVEPRLDVGQFWSPSRRRVEMLSYSPESAESQPDPKTPPPCIDEPEMTMLDGDNAKDSQQWSKLQAQLHGLHGIELLLALSERMLRTEGLGISTRSLVAAHRISGSSDEDKSDGDEYDADSEAVCPAEQGIDACAIQDLPESRFNGRIRDFDGDGAEYPRKKRRGVILEVTPPTQAHPAQTCSNDTSVWGTFAVGWEGHLSIRGPTSGNPEDIAELNRFRLVFLPRNDAVSTPTSSSAVDYGWPVDHCQESSIRFSLDGAYDRERRLMQGYNSVHPQEHYATAICDHLKAHWTHEFGTRDIPLGPEYTRRLRDYVLPSAARGWNILMERLSLPVLDPSPGARFPEHPRLAHRL